MEEDVPLLSHCWERVKTIEYLVPSMSSVLLHKFPDESAFGFDYNQSAIWSPLVTRWRSDSVAVSCPLGSSCKILFDDEHNKRSNKKRKNRDKSKKSKGGVLTSACFGPRLGWGKVLRAATNQFKKQKRSPLLKRIQPTEHLL